MKNRALFLSRKTTLLAVVALLIVLAPPLHIMAAEAESPPQFSSAIDDLPLMPGLTTVKDSDMLFAEPNEGRIAETEASGNVSVDAVYNFYRQSLPHLGWKVLNGHTYVRDGEKLFIDARAEGNVTTVHFSVRPTS